MTQVAAQGAIWTEQAKAASDLSLTRYRFLRWTAVDQVNVASEAASGANDLAGVQLNAADSGDDVTIGVLGEMKVVAGGSITIHNWITTNGSGQAAACSSNQQCVGIALEAAGAAGDVIRCRIWPAQPLLRT